MDLVTDAEKTLQYVLKKCQNGQKRYFLNQNKRGTKGYQVQNFLSSRSNWLQKHEGKEQITGKMLCQLIQKKDSNIC